LVNVVGFVLLLLTATGVEIPQTTVVAPSASAVMLALEQNT
jgi:hypothetical protein